MTWDVALGLIAAISGLGGLITAIVSIRQVRSAAHKTDVEALQVVINTLRAGYVRLAAENEELRAEIARLRKQVEEWRNRYRRLWAWAVRCGLDPEAHLSEEDENGGLGI